MERHKEPDKLRTGNILKRAKELIQIYKFKRPKQLNPDETFHELMIHQAELEIQNEELIRMRIEREELRKKYIDQYDFGLIAYFTIDNRGLITELNLKGANLVGIDRHHLLERSFLSFVQPDDQPKFYAHLKGALSAGKPLSDELRIINKEGLERWFHIESISHKDPDGTVRSIHSILVDITEHKEVEEALEKRLIALTKPLDDSAGIEFEELFNLDDIQRLQDEFANATGVASIITHPDGTPITEPSNFSRLCKDIIRKTDKGCANCYKSDSVLGRSSTQGPSIQPCMSGGLWDAGAGISVGGRHIANWLIGQVRDETQSEEKMRKYARDIEADESDLIEAFREVTAMSHNQFQRIAQVLFTLANQLSAIAYQNIQQARFITERKQAEEALRESEARLKEAQRFWPTRQLGLGCTDRYQHMV